MFTVFVGHIALTTTLLLILRILGLLILIDGIGDADDDADDRLLFLLGHSGSG